jgi:tetratricopeptide (TPR) repeat protein
MAVISDSSLPRRTLLLAGAIIAFSGIVAYINSLGAPFIFDDLDAIVANPTIHSLGASFLPTQDTSVSGRPILNFSLALNYALGHNNPSGYRAVNVLIHILAGLVLFGIIRRTLKRPLLRTLYGNDSAALALALSLMWVLHPLQTESITYVIQRAESLMGLFYLLTLYCFIRGIEHQELTQKKESSIWYTLSLIACYLGVGTKEVMVTAPFIVLCYDRTFASGSFKNSFIARSRWYLGLFLSWIVLGLLIASTGGNRGGSIGFGIGVSWWQYALTQFKAITTYISLSLWPHPLIFARGAFWITNTLEIIPHAVIVLGLFISTLIAFKKNSPLGFLGIWFFAILSPTSSIIPGTTQMIVEHRMYLPLIAILTLALLGLYTLVSKKTTAVFIVLCLPLGYLTSLRNNVYLSSATLWQDTISHEPNNAFAQLNYGVELINQNKFEEAKKHIELSLKLEPNSVEALTNLGNIAIKTGNPEQAASYFNQALTLPQASSQTEIDVANSLLETGQYDIALTHYEKAISLKPQSPEAECNLGIALSRLGRVNEALPHFEKSIKNNPDFPPAHFNRANAYRRLGKFDEAITEYKITLQLNPNYADAALNLGNLFLQAGNLNEAIGHFKQVLRINPNYAEAHNSLGLAFARANALTDAVTEFKEALRLKPNYPAAASNLAHAENILNSTHN